MSSIIAFHRSLVKIHRLSNMRSNRPFMNKYFNKKILDKFWEEHAKYADNLLDAINEGINNSSMKYILDMCISLYTLYEIDIAISSYNTDNYRYTFTLEQPAKPYMHEYNMELTNKTRSKKFYITLWTDSNDKGKPIINENSSIVVRSSIRPNVSYCKDIIESGKNCSAKEIILEFRKFYFNTVVSSIYQDCINNIKELEQLCK